MGVPELIKILKTHYPHVIETPVTLAGKTVAIDISIYIYKWASVGQKFAGASQVNHLQALANFAYAWLVSDITPIFVFDGKPPDLKSDTIESRKIAKIGRLWKSSQVFPECIKLLDMLGLQYMLANGEAEAACAELVSSGMAYCVITEDLDSLVFGADIVVRGCISGAKMFKNASLIRLERVLEVLGFTNESQFRWFCALLGGDYTDRYNGWSWKKCRDIAVTGKYDGIPDIYEHAVREYDVHPSKSVTAVRRGKQDVDSVSKWFNELGITRNTSRALSYLAKHDTGYSGGFEHTDDLKLIKMAIGNTPPGGYVPCETIDDIPGELVFIPNTGDYRAGVHLGQRKLGLSEIEFLVNCRNEIGNSGREFLCVYAGAAPSYKMGLLGRLFPEVKFLLVDPNPFHIYDAKATFIKCENWGNLREICEQLRVVRDTKIERSISANNVGDCASNQIYVINGYFTQLLASALRDIFAYDIAFISDIRTNLSSGSVTGIGSIMPDTVDITWNLSQQYNWIYIMKPFASLVKFRHPFYEDLDKFRETCDDKLFKDDYLASLGEKVLDGCDEKIVDNMRVDFVKNALSNKLVYYPGKIYMQVWHGQSSTETRLFIVREDLGKLVEYNKAYYEIKHNWYNKIARGYQYFQNKHTCKNIYFDNCADCALEALIWERYLASGNTEFVDKLYSTISDVDGTDKVCLLVQILTLVTTRRGLRNLLHIGIFDRINEEEFRKITKMAKKRHVDHAHFPFDPKTAVDPRYKKALDMYSQYSVILHENSGNIFHVMRSSKTSSSSD